MKNIFVIGALFVFFVSSGQTTHDVYLHSRMNGVVNLDDGSSTQFWGYGEYLPPTPVPQDKIFLPGPFLRFNEGDTVNVHFYNDSPEDHSIHWHGLDVDQANDGVPTTSSAVDPNMNRIYTFVCTHAGTYNYHCHVLTMLHLAMGMYGLLVVDPDDNRNMIYTNGPRYSKDYNWLATEMNKNWNDNPLSPGPFYQYLATNFLLNGKEGSQLINDPANHVIGTLNDTIALRLANLGYGKTTYYFPEDANAEIHMSDGRKLPTHIISDSLEVFSGERYTVILYPSAEINDVIRIVYSDLRTESYLGENNVPILIQEFFNDVEELEEDVSDIKIKGNPIEEMLVIENSGQISQEVQIFSIQGKLIQSFDLNVGLHIIPFNETSGIYLLKISDGKTLQFVK